MIQIMSTNNREASSDGSRPCVSIISCVRDWGEYRANDRAPFPFFVLDRQNDRPSIAEIIVVDSSQDAKARNAIKNTVESLGGVYVYEDTHTQKYSLARARNLGAAAARGEFLLFVDIDLIAPTGFLQALHYFLENGRIGKADNFFSIIPVIYLNEGPNAQVIADIRAQPLTYWLHGEGSRNVNSIQLVNSTLCVRKSFYSLLGGQHESFRGWGMEDWHFLWKLMTFPQPVPGPSTATPFHSIPACKSNDLESWRDAAWFIGDEALRHGLFLFHIPHERRDWRTSSSENKRRFNALIEDRMVFEASPILKFGASRRVYSDDPVVANALLFPPEDHVSVGNTKELEDYFLRTTIPEVRPRPLIGAAQPDGCFYAHFDKLAQKGEPFDFLYPSGLPYAMFYFSHENGTICVPRSVAQSHSVDLRASYDLEVTAVNAQRFRHSGWRNDKFLVLFILSEDRQAPQDAAETCGDLFGLSSVGFRSMTHALIPLLDSDIAGMIYDLHNDGTKLSFAAENAFDVSDQGLDLLIQSADVVVAQAPRFTLNAVALGKPVITTGTLLSDILPSVPVARTLFDVNAFIKAMHVNPIAAVQEDIESALSHACLFVADDRGAPAPADLLRRENSARVLYEQVATPCYTARFDFRQQLENPSLPSWLWPHLDEQRAAQRHLSLTHDPWFNRPASSLSRKAAVPKTADKLASRMARIKERSESVQSLVLDPRLAANVEKRKAMYRESRSASAFSSKIAKLKRDPRQFFADSKTPALRLLRFIFPIR